MFFIRIITNAEIVLSTRYENIPSQVSGSWGKPWDPTPKPLKGAAFFALVFPIGFC